MVESTALPPAALTTHKPETPKPYGQIVADNITVEDYYKLHHPDADGNYQTPALPKLALHVPTLWQAELPNIVTVVQAVQTMLADPK